MSDDQTTEVAHLRIARRIREVILAGEIAEGEVLNEASRIGRANNAMAEDATRALRLLRADGLVVASDEPHDLIAFGERGGHHSAWDRVARSTRSGRICPPDHYAVLGEVTTVEASDEVADGLLIEPGSKVIQRPRVTFDGRDRPVSASVSWFPRWLVAEAPLLASSERIVEGTASCIARCSGRVVAWVSSRHAATAADAEVSAALAVAEGSPVLISYNRYVDQFGDVVEYGRSVSLSDRPVFFDLPVTSR